MKRESPAVTIRIIAIQGVKLETPIKGTWRPHAISGGSFSVTEKLPQWLDTTGAVYPEDITEWVE